MGQSPVLNYGSLGCVKLLAAFLFDDVGAKMKKGSQARRKVLRDFA